MVSRASDSIGPLQQPTAPPEKNSPLLDFASLKLPGFHLQEVQGVNGYVHHDQTSNYHES